MKGGRVPSLKGMKDSQCKGKEVKDNILKGNSKGPILKGVWSVTRKVMCNQLAKIN